MFFFAAALGKRATVTKPDILENQEFGCNEDGKVTWQTEQKRIKSPVKHLRWRAL